MLPLPCMTAAKPSLTAARGKRETGAALYPSLRCSEQNLTRLIGENASTWRLLSNSLLDAVLSPETSADTVAPLGSHFLLLSRAKTGESASGFSLRYVRHPV